MSLIPCPECGTDISERATRCPYCGFQSDDPSKPISDQDHYLKIPQFHIFNQISDDNERFFELPESDNKKLFDYLGSLSFIKDHIPNLLTAIAKVLKTTRKELVADIDRLGPKINEI